jgi:hypothetical protein
VGASCSLGTKYLDSNSLHDVFLHITLLIFVILLTQKRRVVYEIADEVALQNRLDQCLSDMPLVKGCIQASMVLRDAAFVNMASDI